MAGNNTDLVRNRSTDGFIKNFRPGISTSTVTPPCREGRLWFDPNGPSVVGVENWVNITGDYTATLIDQIIYADATGGAITVTLPAMADAPGKVFRIYKDDASGNTVTIDPDGSETINGSSTFVITTHRDTSTIHNNNIEWKII